MTGKEIRLDRLFSGGNAVVVAVDHGEFDGPLPGMINMPEVVKKIDSGVSAVLLSPGMISHCGHAFNYKGAPMSMMRLNWSTHFVFHWKYNQGISVPAISPIDAFAAGAEIALVCLTLKTGSEAIDAANVESFTSLVNEAKSLGMPVVGEYFPARSDELSQEEMHEQIYMGCRIVAELGADLIKTFHTYKFKEVTESCPIPILGLGAEKTPKQIQALELAEKIIQDGGSGVVFGRNAIQVADPASFQKALIEVVRNGVSAVDAVAKYGLIDQ
ncbi:MAG: class I fructose-bisphosphate aldolase [Armatimonadota bacterium]